MNKSNLRVLQSEIKNAAKAGRDFNAHIQAARGPERSALRGQKAAIGWTARHLLLAYLLLREVPYRVGEAVTRTQPSISKLRELALSHGADLDAATIKQWLETEKTARVSRRVSSGMEVSHSNPTAALVEKAVG